MEDCGKGGRDEGEKLDFSGMTALFVESGIQTRRLQIWKQKFEQFGGKLEAHRSKHVTHLFAANCKTLQDRIGHASLKKKVALKYEWIEDCLKAGHILPSEKYTLKFPSDQDTLALEEPSTLALGSSTLASGSSTLFEDHGSRDNSRSVDDAGGSSTKKKKRREGMITTESDPAEESHWMEVIKEGAHMGMVHHSAVVGGDKKSQEQDHLEEGLGFIGSVGSTAPIAELATSDGLSDVGSAQPLHPDLPENQLTGPVYTPPDLNTHITGPLKEIRDIYKEALGDDRRYFSYYKALSVLEKVPFKITSVDQIKGLPTLGKSLLDTIQEILTTGKMSKLEHLKADKKVKVLSLFGAVWGIGPSTAQKLYDKGHRSLEDLKTDTSLTPAQRVGLEFHEDIIKRIPRHEVKEMEAIVQKAAAELRPNISVVCGGSYRRGKATVGDLDIVITHPDGHSHTGLMNELLAKLKNEGFLAEDLMHGHQHSTEGTDSGVDTYFGLCKYPGREQRHRIDFKIYPWEMYPFGLLAWTGNDVLNRRLRIVAEAKGYKLDDHGLYPVVRDEHGNRVKSGASVPCKSEREIFDTLGFPWLEPHARNL
ncbi:hypothetical protein BDL97_16G084800 [Sphagnum fallax]|nr:hypothetical protein BDL97_16G084800 [Sphagnum fallax]